MTQINLSKTKTITYSELATIANGWAKVYRRRVAFLGGSPTWAKALSRAYKEAWEKHDVVVSLSAELVADRLREEREDSEQHTSFYSTWSHHKYTS